VVIGGDMCVCVCVCACVLFFFVVFLRTHWYVCILFVRTVWPFLHVAGKSFLHVAVRVRNSLRSSHRNSNSVERTPLLAGN
jgi:hypothetical protein